MNQADVEWLKNPVIKQAEVARRFGISRDLFSKKLNQVDRNQFTAEERQRLDALRREIITELQGDSASGSELGAGLK